MKAMTPNKRMQSELAYGQAADAGRKADHVTRRFDQMHTPRRVGVYG